MPRILPPPRVAGTVPGKTPPVDFDDRARLDTSRVRDARGRRGAGRGLAVGGGGLGLLGLVVALLLGVDPSVLTGGSGVTGYDVPGASEGVATGTS